jgi:sugar phosphate permease
MNENLYSGETGKKFKHWQTRTIVVAMIGYALYYFVRKNFSLTMPALEAEFGLSKVQLGLFLTLNGVIYGLSRFVNGFIADRVSARKMMSIGLCLSGIINLGFAFSDKFATVFTVMSAGHGYITALAIFMGTLWLINGYLQGMGVPPVSPLMTHWIPSNELATKMSIWNTSHSIGAGLIAVICGLILGNMGVNMSHDPATLAAISSNLASVGVDVTSPDGMARVANVASHLGAWRFCFIIPAIIALFGSFFILVTLKDNPKSVGLPEVNSDTVKIAGDSKEAQSEDSKAEYKYYVRHKVFGNRLIWTLAITNFFIYIVRFAFLDWGPTLLNESKGIPQHQASYMLSIFELTGGILGMLAAGWATDHWFHNKGHQTCVVCMIGVVLSVVAFILTPSTAPWYIVAIPYTLISFFIYGPQALLGIEAANQATKKAAATANGLLGIFGYASTVVSGVVFGWIAQKYGWSMVYTLILIMSGIAIVTLVTMWGAKADGYGEDPKTEPAK